jgi:hypothetical protein
VGSRPRAGWGPAGGVEGSGPWEVRGKWSKKVSQVKGRAGDVPSRLRVWRVVCYVMLCYVMLCYGMVPSRLREWRVTWPSSNSAERLEMMTCEPVRDGMGRGGMGWGGVGWGGVGWGGMG